MRQLAPETEGKRFSIGFRTTKSAKDRIEAEAKANGRSVAQEIEYRIDAGYRILDANRFAERSNAVANALLGDEKTAEMIRSFSAAVGAVMAYTGKHWDVDVYTRGAVQACLDAARSAHFSDEKLGLKPSDIDLEQMRKAIELGTLYGRLIAASRNDPTIAATVSEMAAATAGPDVQARSREVVAELLRGAA
ncbi:hypothetical protein Q8W71_27305 [Methylobacterium sp. NEAU 140]|uniref:hypothetical protein n=1 Tax=Methylobacterium sp. NEAU 140 TaxID=3064945 RepID=UPI0027353086|nr:hypothetical protein [Methylobacterium sp. NEAU 140]MDP4026336.1 hypothetical protein [Methylobacterium sp. NEAU 140]